MHSPKSIVLIGFMGAGKSSVGGFLERRTGLACIDTDELISTKFAMSIPEFFAEYGEAKFRDAETDVLREVTPDRPTIVVTGGGTILRTENLDLLKRLGIIVWLDADEEVLFERATRKPDRPLLKTANPREKFRSLLATRKVAYSAGADIRIDTTHSTHEEVADAILKELDHLVP